MNRNRSPLLMTTGAVALALALAGCNTATATGDPDTGEDGGSSVTEDFTTGVQESEGFPSSPDAGEGLYPTGLRSGVHEDFERIVIDHAGSGVPGFHAEYVEEPLAPGSGAPVELDGQAHLQVNLTGMAGFDAIGDDALENHTGWQVPDTAAVAEVVTFLPWEATSTYFIGVDAERPYHVHFAEDPTRVIVDVATD